MTKREKTMTRNDRGQQPQSRVSRPVKVALAAACMLSLGLGMALHGDPHFSFEALPGFDALLGLGGVVALVLVARLASVVLRRGEGYYDQ